jgi:hypothetical protein
MFLNLSSYKKYSNDKRNYYSQTMSVRKTTEKMNKVSTLQKKREVVKDTLPDFKTLNSKLIECRGHLGHLIFRWNPKMLKYIYTISKRRGQKKTYY